MVSNEPALHAFAVIDRDYHVVASLYRVEPKRRSRQHEVSRFQGGAEAAEVVAEPLDRLGSPTSHRPQCSSIDCDAVDDNRQCASSDPIIERHGCMVA